MVTTVIRDIKIIFISRATDDLRMILKKDIPPEGNITLEVMLPTY